MNTDSKTELTDIVVPSAADAMPTAALMLSGPPIEPLTRLMTYNSDEWEKFINELKSGPGILNN